MLGDRLENDQVNRDAEFTSEGLQFIASGDSLSTSPAGDGGRFDAELAGQSGLVDYFEEFGETPRLRYGVHATILGLSASYVKASAPQDRRIRHANRNVMTLGARLRTFRGNVSQRELAARAGLDITTINRIENDKIDPTVRTVERITGALGVTLAQFFQETTPRGAADGASESRLPEGPFADAIHLLRGEIAAVMAVALEAREMAEEAKRSTARRARKSA